MSTTYKQKNECVFVKGVIEREKRVVCTAMEVVYKEKRAPKLQRDVVMRSCPASELQSQPTSAVCYGNANRMAMACCKYYDIP